MNKILFVLAVAALCTVLYFRHKHPNKIEPAVPRKGVQIEVRKGSEFEPTIQVYIDEKDRIPNRTGCQCGWSSLETIGRSEHITELYDITREQEGYIDCGSAARVLTDKGVKFVEQEQGNKDTAILEKYVRGKHYGAAVGLHGTHMITLVHYDPKKGIVKVIDNCGPNALVIREWTMEKFLDNWDGFTIVPLPQNGKPCLVFIVKVKPGDTVTVVSEISKR